MKKYISYSELNCWESYNDKYYEQYVECKPFEPNRKMILGKIIHNAIENPHYKWLEEMNEHNFQKKKQLVARTLIDKMIWKLGEQQAKNKINGYEPEKKIGCDLDDLKLFGIFDGFDSFNRELDEFKTTDNDDRWNQWTVDFDGQLSFYALILFQKYHSYFREIRLHRLNTVKGTLKTYRTTRSRLDVNRMQKRVTKAVAEMKFAGIWGKRKSRKEAEDMHKQQLNLEGGDSR